MSRYLKVLMILACLTTCVSADEVIPPMNTDEAKVIQQTSGHQDRS